MRFRAPASVLLRRAQLTLMLAALIPTVLMTLIGIVLLILGTGSVTLVTGILVLALCTSSITGYVLGSILVSRGASLARVQNDFLSSVSHELRTPLTSIRMFIETLRDDRLTDPEQKDQCLQLLEREVKRLEELVNRLLELSRMETGRHLFERQPVDLADVIDDALAAFDATTVPARVPVETDIAPDLIVTGDRATLAQAVTNLLINAWKYTSAEERQIAVRAHRLGDRHIVLAVEDNGPGIPWGEQRHIFEKFERGRKALDSNTGGVGLGLAIVRAIASAHRGRVEVRSRTGHGAQFRLVLPRRRKPS
jgi:two-component system, OmpR family, phosphate regulon sensor histidine kinase PhoR